MREAGLRGISRRRFATTTVRDEAARPAPDLVERRFAAEGPDRLWVADITYIRTWAGFVYLAIVLDVVQPSRGGLGDARALAHRARARSAADGDLAAAAPERDHSDPGLPYTSIAFGHRCERLGVRTSMGSVGDAYDNAMAESFFATLECELLDQMRFKTQHEAQQAIFEWIEAGTTRTGASIDYLSPIEFERRHAAAVRLGDSAPEPPFMNESKREQEGLARQSHQLSTEPSVAPI